MLDIFPIWGAALGVVFARRDNLGPPFSWWLIAPCVLVAIAAWTASTFPESINTILGSPAIGRWEALIAQLCAMTVVWLLIVLRATKLLMTPKARRPKSPGFERIDIAFFGLVAIGYAIFLGLIMFADASRSPFPNAQVFIVYAVTLSLGHIILKSPPQQRLPTTLRIIGSICAFGVGAALVLALATAALKSS